MDFNLKCIDDTILNTLNQTIPFPVLIFNLTLHNFKNDNIMIELFCY